MNRLCYAALASSILATANGQSPEYSISSGRAFDRQISVHLYNLSGIPAQTLDRAAGEASKVFAQAGVNILWEAGDPIAAEAHSTDQSAPASFRDRHVRSYLVVRIGRGMALHVPSAALGVSLPYAQFGASATIFQERVERLCAAAGQDFAVLLGHAIAHELGHVILASHGHAPIGIMRASWGKAEFQQAAAGLLGFTAQQGAEIRDYVSRRDSQALVAPRKGPGVGMSCNPEYETDAPTVPGREMWRLPIRARRESGQPMLEPDLCTDRRFTRSGNIPVTALQALTESAQLPICVRSTPC